MWVSVLLVLYVWPGSPACIDAPGGSSACARSVIGGVCILCGHAYADTQGYAGMLLGLSNCTAATSAADTHQEVQCSWGTACPVVQPGQGSAKKTPCSCSVHKCMDGNKPAAMPAVEDTQLKGVQMEEGGITGRCTDCSRALAVTMHMHMLRTLKLPRYGRGPKPPGNSGRFLLIDWLALCTLSTMAYAYRRPGIKPAYQPGGRITTWVGMCSYAQQSYAAPGVHR